MRRSLFLLVAVLSFVGMIAISGCKKDEDSSNSNVEIHGSQQHEWVDLGLPSGTFWATCNVGANAPEEYGNYFAWGEITTKETYTFDTYKYFDGSNLTKYTDADTLTVLESCDDAATANWGTGWRMPTQEEFQELVENCDATWTIHNGVNGVLFTSRVNTNFIFLPAAGYYEGSSLDGYGDGGCYWSSSSHTGHYSGIAWYLSLFYSDDCEMRAIIRSSGMPVRAVCAQ